MKATGIVRRIDDLGRVVIPKEIRRTLRSRMGAPLTENIDTGYGVLHGCGICCGAVHREVNDMPAGLPARRLHNAGGGFDCIRPCIFKKSTNLS